MTNEFRSKYEVEKKDPFRAWYPIIGLVLIALAGGAAFIARAPAYAFVKNNFLQNVGNLPEDRLMEYVVAFAITLAILGVFSMAFAIMAPKPKYRKEVSESTLKEQKNEMLREQERAKRRKRQMEAKMRKANRAKDK